MSLRPLVFVLALVLGAAALTLLVAGLVEPMLGGPALPLAIPAAMALGLLARALYRRP